MSLTTSPRQGDITQELPELAPLHARALPAAADGPWPDPQEGLLRSMAHGVPGLRRSVRPPPAVDSGEWHNERGTGAPPRTKPP
ncbi:hypothetical protein ACWD4K_31850 [Streptomyces gelaticus]